MSSVPEAFECAISVPFFEAALVLSLVGSSVRDPANFVARRRAAGAAEVNVLRCKQAVVAVKHVDRF
jgi:hypothetical protein